MDFRTPYNFHDLDTKHQWTLFCKDKTLAQQQFKDQCDINILYARYLETGEMPQVQDGLAYGDFTGIFDYQTAMNAVLEAQGMFQKLPARIKNRFDNDPQKLLSFLGNDENREEAEFLGLIAKPEKEENEPRREETPGQRTLPPTQPDGAASRTTTAQGPEKP